MHEVISPRALTKQFGMRTTTKRSRFAEIKYGFLLLPSILQQYYNTAEAHTGPVDVSANDSHRARGCCIPLCGYKTRRFVFPTNLGLVRRFLTVATCYTYIYMLRPFRGLANRCEVDVAHPQGRTNQARCPGADRCRRSSLSATGALLTRCPIIANMRRAAGSKTKKRAQQMAMSRVRAYLPTLLLLFVGLGARL